MIYLLTRPSVARSRVKATAASSFESNSTMTRDQKTLDGNTIDVHLGSGATLFVTNFPPTADEAYIRNLFQKYGEIVDVRFPSLKYNTHRRFCYVQFKSPSDAHRASELDGTTVEKDLRLVARISDPSRKQDRHGPMHEGREIHVSNLDWNASEDDLKDLFSVYGKVEVARIPRKVDGGSKGFGYVVFATKTPNRKRQMPLLKCISESSVRAHYR